MTKEELDELIKLWNSAPLSGTEMGLLVDGLIEHNTILKKGIRAVQSLISESDGVYGLHHNGDPSPWSELQKGGYYEEWLMQFNDAEDLL